MKARTFLVALTLPALALAGACDDPTGFGASLETVTDTLIVRAFTGATTSDATAINTHRPAAVRTDLGSGYDIVFDLDQDGNVLLHPPSKIANVGRAGLREATEPFEQIAEAVVDGYNEMDTVTAAVGDVYYIRAFPPGCSANIRPFVYSKLVIDSVDPVNRLIHVRITVNPNCGFRSFAEGVPTF